MEFYFNLERDVVNILNLNNELSKVVRPQTAFSILYTI